MNPKLLIFSFLFSLIGSGLYPEERTWTSLKGNQIIAELINVDSGFATLRKTDGKVIQVRIKQISLKDRKYIEKVLSGDSNPFETYNIKEYLKHKEKTTGKIELSEKDNGKTNNRIDNTSKIDSSFQHDIKPQINVTQLDRTSDKYFKIKFNNSFNLNEFYTGMDYHSYPNQENGVYRDGEGDTKTNDPFSHKLDVLGVKVTSPSEEEIMLSIEMVGSLNDLLKNPEFLEKPAKVLIQFNWDNDYETGFSGWGHGEETRVSVTLGGRKSMRCNLMHLHEFKEVSPFEVTNINVEDSFFNITCRSPILRKIDKLTFMVKIMSGLGMSIIDHAPSYQSYQQTYLYDLPHSDENRLKLPYEKERLIGNALQFVHFLHKEAPTLSREDFSDYLQPTSLYLKNKKTEIVDRIWSNVTQIKEDGKVLFTSILMSKQLDFQVSFRISQRIEGINKTESVTVNVPRSMDRFSLDSISYYPK